MKRIKLTIYTLTALILPLLSANASGIAKNTAKMQAMDKITGRVSVINVPVGGAVQFGSLSIVVRACKTRPAEETPDNFAFADITDKTLQGEEFNIFKGWMISSSPATHAVEHPIYDVWLLQCTDEKVDKKLLLSEEQLAKRDTLPMNKTTAEDAKKADNQEKEDALELTQTISEMEDEHKQEQTAPEIQAQPEFFYDEEDAEAEAEAEDEAESGEVAPENSENSEI
jgi:hypothetical protein